MAAAKPALGPPLRICHFLTSFREKKNSGPALDFGDAICNFFFSLFFLRVGSSVIRETVVGKKEKAGGAPERSFLISVRMRTIPSIF